MLTPSPKKFYRMYVRTPEGKRFEAKPSIITNPPTLLTITRKSRKLDSISSDTFSKPQKRCTGPPVLMIMKYGRRCWKRKNKTKWVCQGCHVFIYRVSTCRSNAVNDYSREIYSISDHKFNPSKNQHLFFLENGFISSHPSLQINELPKPM